MQESLNNVYEDLVLILKEIKSPKLLQLCEELESIINEQGEKYE